MRRKLLFILLTVTSVNAQAQSWQDTVNTITHFFDRYKPNAPGCQLAISRNGKLIFSKAWGQADLEHAVPCTTETVTEAGSITKQITAAAVLLLQQQGKLSLNDDVRRYIPELPNYGYMIRIGHLLHHTSGIREWSDLEAITGWPRTTKAYTNEDVLNLLCRQAGLNNIPGAEYIYSNSNYLLLTLIVERVSGMKLPDFTREYIFKPAGMLHTSWRDDFKKIVTNRGIAYAKKKDGYQINMPNENVYGPGGLLTTAEDLLKWTNFFLNNKLGSPGLLKQQLSIDPLPGGAETIYATGLFIGKFRGYDIVSHTGQTAGYVGVVESLPALNLSVAWLSNTTEFKDSLFVGITAIDNLFIKDIPSAETTKNSIVAHPDLLAPQLNKYAGWYRYNATNKGIDISLNGDTLRLNNTPLIAQNEKEFRYTESSIRFTKEGFVLHTADKRLIKFTREPTVKPTLVYLKSFAGIYYSKETDSRFTLALKHGKLMLGQNYLKDVVLSPTYKAAFNFYLNLDSDMEPVEANIRFTRGGKNCEVSMSDARKIGFVKVK
jgi:CubicO group peptidase (beta-lactamase class C family)